MVFQVFGGLLIKVAIVECVRVINSRPIGSMGRLFPWAPGAALDVGLRHWFVLIHANAIAGRRGRLLPRQAEVQLLALGVARSIPSLIGLVPVQVERIISSFICRVGA